MKLREYRPSSFSDYIKIIGDIRSKHPKVWYRGVRDARHDLVPSLLRRTDLKGRDKFTNLEKELIARFRERSLPYLTHQPTDHWDWLFFMQHYGIPTRLLDWTENPFVGLYFAVRYAAKSVKGEYKRDAAIWLVDPVAWNNSVLSFQGFEEGILGTTDEQLSPFKPPADFSNIPNYALALHGAYNSARIVAQRGTFFIFGAPGHPMNTYSDSQVSPGCLEKIIIQKDRIGRIRKDLLESGITDSVVFPDLEGLSQEIKRDFAFEE